LSHTKDLIDEVLEKIQNYLQNEDVDFLTFHKPKNFKFRHIPNSLLEKVGLHLIRIKELEGIDIGKSFGKSSCIQFFNLALRNPELYDEFYDLIEDEKSKKEYDWFVRYRTVYSFLGESVAYNLFPPEITKETFHKFEAQIKESKDGCFEIDDFHLKNEKGLLVSAFFIEQYRLPNLVEPKSGDIILDIGACFGDTAFWFRKYVGDEGKIYAFEPVNYNLDILKENIEKNKITNIIPQKLALDDTEGEFQIVGAGGVAKLSSYGSEKVKVTTIDKFVEDQKIDRVNFIKMDIEGAELSALKGGKNTIKKFKPKLAICVYHKGDDLITIPNYIKSVNKDYKFYLRHNSPWLGETVLYANV